MCVYCACVCVKEAVCTTHILTTAVHANSNIVKEEARRASPHKEKNYGTKTAQWTHAITIFTLPCLPIYAGLSVNKVFIPSAVSLLPPLAAGEVSLHSVTFQFPGSAAGEEQGLTHLPETESTSSNDLPSTSVGVSQGRAYTTSS